jgi:hypothetical protein
MSSEARKRAFVLLMTLMLKTNLREGDVIENIKTAP